MEIDVRFIATAAAEHADMDPKNFSEKLTRYGLRRAQPAEPADDARGDEGD